MLLESQLLPYFDPGYLFTPSDSFSLAVFLARTYRLATIQNVTDDRQTTTVDRRQTTLCAKGTTDSTVGQKLMKFGRVVFESCQQTDKTDRHMLITILHTSPEGKLTNYRHRLKYLMDRKVDE